MKAEPTLDAVVIGAGLAGLSAAAALHAAGRSVRVLEARPRVGGRTERGEILGQAVDVGGQWVGPTQARVLALVRRLGLQTFPQYAQGARLMEMHGRLGRYRGTIPKLPVLALLDVARLLSRVNRLAAKLDPAAPWSAPGARELDLVTAHEWLLRNAYTRDGRELIAVAVRAIWSCEPHELSMLWLLNYVRAAGSFETLAEIPQGAQQDRILGGAFQLAQRLAAELPPQALLLDAPVPAIEQDAASVRVIHARGEVRARRVIVACAPLLAARIDYAAALPARREQLASRMPMGSVIKLLVAYERPFWREAGLSGEAISDAGPLSPVMDAGLPGREEGLLVGFVEGAHGRELGALDAEARRAAVVRTLVRYFGPQAAQPIGYVEKNWIADPWSRGCYVGLAQPGVLSECGAALREPCGRIHWAGTETATAWIGYMDGAIESGERAAREVMAGA